MTRSQKLANFVQRTDREQTKLTALSLALPHGVMNGLTGRDKHNILALHCFGHSRWFDWV